MKMVLIWRFERYLTRNSGSFKSRRLLPKHLKLEYRYRQISKHSVSLLVFSRLLRCFFFNFVCRGYPFFILILPAALSRKQVYNTGTSVRI